jgi:hypothetical protein
MPFRDKSGYSNSLRNKTGYGIKGTFDSTCDYGE